MPGSIAGQDVGAPPKRFTGGRGPATDEDEENDTTAGTFDYRAVTLDLTGYTMCGYSPPRSLRVTS